MRTYVLTLVDESETRLRSLSYVHASPLPAEEVAVFYGVEGPGLAAPVALDRACRFGNRPSLLVLSVWTPGQGTALDPEIETLAPPSVSSGEFWGGGGAVVTDIADAPAGTRSFFQLRLAQRKVDGVFGLS